MARKAARMSTRQRFFLRNFITIVLPVVCVVVLLGVLSVWRAYAETRQTVAREEQQAISRVADSLGIYFSDVDAQNLNYQSSSYILLRMEAILRENGYTEKSLMDSANLIKNNLDATVNAKPYIHSILIYLNNDNHSFFVSGVGLANQYNYRDTQWLEEYEASAYEQAQWLSQREVGQYSLTRQKTNVISLFKKLYRAGQKKPMGVIVLNVRLEAVQDLLEGQIVYAGQRFELVDDAGMLLAEAGAATESTGKNAVVFTGAIADYGMQLRTIIPRAQLFSRVQAMISFVLLSAGAALLVGAVLALWVTHKNVHSIMNIANLIERAERGEVLDGPVSTRQDMYDVIMQNIVQNFAMRSVLEAKLAEEKYALQGMYYAFLQAQMNPHFLINTLKNIYWMTVSLTGKPNKASEMIDLLTGLLSYTLVKPDRPVTLREEQAQTMRYLSIQKTRFQEAFSVRWEVDETLLDVPCIKFLLQPLAENSISHGLTDREDGELTLSVQREGENIRVVVTDNGQGMSAERLNQVRAMLLERKPPERSIGLYNLSKRLTLIYGECAQLHIESAENEGTSISFVIPPVLPKDKK